MTILKKWWPTILPVLLMIGSALTPVITNFLSAHPEVSTILASIYAILTHLLPSPVTSGGGTATTK